MLGKGGVGKSVVCATLGRAAAARGRRTLVIEVAHGHGLAKVFGRSELPSEQPADLGGGLFGVAIDVERSTEEYLSGQLRIRPLVELLVHSRAFHHFAQAAPGLAELVTVGKIWKLAVELRPGGERPLWDVLVVDCPATGHGIALLETAGNARQLAGDGPIRDQAARIEEVIVHPAATGVVLVARAQELAVSEAVEAAGRLRERRIPLAAAVLNATAPDRFSEEERLALEQAARTGTGAVRAAAAAALREHARAGRDRAYAERLRAGTGLPLLALPELPGRTIDSDAVSELAAGVDVEGMRAA